MLDTFALTNSIFLITDSDNCILSCTRYPSVANAITQIVPGTKINLINPGKFTPDDKLFNNFRPEYWKSTFGKKFDNHTLIEFSPTEEWQKQKDFAVSVTECLQIFENTIYRYAARTVFGINNSLFDQTMSKEIELSNRETLTFSPAILEYAEITGLAPEQVYDEIKMVTTSNAISLVRLHAFWHKWVNYFKALDPSNPIDRKTILSNMQGNLRYGTEQ